MNLNEYDHVVVGYSGGKDSLACVLDLLERDCDPDRIELWHQHIDGEPGTRGLMDWPITEGYVKTTGRMLGLTTLFQWRDGGFEKEMLRDNAPTGNVHYERSPDGERVCLPSNRNRLGTRLQFPQVSGDLKVRWCSPYLKIDVAARVINNEPRFLGGRTLYVTGERRQESAQRAKYLKFEPHRCDVRKRRVDHYRPVIDWSENEVWEIIKRNRIRSHPCYYLGFGRASCMKCIFGNDDQWTTVRILDPVGFDLVAAHESRSGKTIKRNKSIVQLADQGVSTIPDAMDLDYRELAMGKEFPDDLFFFPTVADWIMPAGAFKHCGGPT